MGRCGVRRVSRRAKTLAADGEVVWSWRRDPGVYPPCLCGAGNGDNKGRSPGRARISRKTIARGKPGCLGCTCQIRVRSLSAIAHGATGAVGARLSLRPLSERGTTSLQNSGEIEPRERAPTFPPSLRAKRSNPASFGPTRKLDCFVAPLLATSGAEIVGGQSASVPTFEST